MEIEAENRTAIPLYQTSNTEFGRGIGFNTKDRTVSRRHVSFKPQSEKSSQTNAEFESRGVQFEVIGKNPMWVRSGRSEEIKVFKRGDGGEMEGGDLFCVSGKTPVWFGLKRKRYEDEVFERLETSSKNGVSVTSFEPDLSDTDPVKEFGFLVMGHEFDCYSKQMIRDIKNWDWFLEEARKDSDGEDVSEKKGRSVRKKRKNAGGIDGDDDDEWAGESEDDKELVSKPRKLQRPNYSTRSKDGSSKPFKNSKTSKSIAHKKNVRANEEEEEEDEDENEDEETLGGFIVNNEDVEPAEESDEDEEEEFDEDDNDEEIND